MKKLENIAFLKTSMMFFVVLYHCMIFFGGNWINFISPIKKVDLIYQIAIFINSFHIQTFCMASGYLYFYNKLNNNNKNNDFDFIINKIKKLIIPYLLICMFWVIPFNVYFSKVNYFSNLCNILLGIKCGQLWFLVMLFDIFIIFCLFFKKQAFTYKELAIVFLLSTIGSQILFKLEFNYFQIAVAVQFIFYFYLGGFILNNEKKITKTKIVLILICLIILIPVSYIKTKFSLIQILIKFISILKSALEVVIIYIIASKLATKIFKFKIYKVFEKNSFGIYLFHQQILYVILFIINGKFNVYIQLSITFIMCLIMSLVITLVLKQMKPLKRVLNI